MSADKENLFVESVLMTVPTALYMLAVSLPLSFMEWTERLFFVGSSLMSGAFLLFAAIVYGAWRLFR